MSNEQLIVSLADKIDAAYAGETIAPIRNEVENADVDLAYRIQLHNHQRWIAAGKRAVGKKIGLTSKAVQQQLGVDQPDFGFMYADSSFCSGDVIPASQYLQPKVEAEIAFVLKSDLNTSDITITDLIGAIDYAVAALEIVDSRIANWDIRLFDTVADNASYGGFVLGTTPVPLSQLDLENCQMQMTRDGEVVSSGEGRACLGNPLNATLWLAKTMIANGQPLLAGDVILSGALGPMVPCHSGESYVATIDGLNSVSIKFS